MLSVETPACPELGRVREPLSPSGMTGVVMVNADFSGGLFPLSRLGGGTLRGPAGSRSRRKTRRT